MEYQLPGIHYSLNRPIEATIELDPLPPCNVVHLKCPNLPVSKTALQMIWFEGKSNPRFEHASPWVAIERNTWIKRINSSILSFMRDFPCKSR